MSRRFVYFQGEEEIIRYEVLVSYTFGPTGPNNSGPEVVARARLTQSSTLAGLTIGTPNNNVRQPATLTNGAALQMSGEAEANWNANILLRNTGSLSQTVVCDFTDTLQTNFIMTGTMEDLGDFFVSAHRLRVLVRAIRVSSFSGSTFSDYLLDEEYRVSFDLGANLSLSENIPIDITTIFPGDF